MSGSQPSPQKTLVKLSIARPLDDFQVQRQSEFRAMVRLAKQCIIKQLLDSVVVITRIIKVVSVPWLIT